MKINILHPDILLNQNKTFFDNGQPIPANYKGLSYIPYYEKCGEPYDDYINLSVNNSLSLLNDNSFINRN